MKKLKKQITGVLAACIAVGIGVPSIAVTAPAVSAMDSQSPEGLDELAEPGTGIHSQEAAAIQRNSSGSSGSAAQVISTALAQVGYTETSSEYTKFGQWYGLSNAYWCDMFVSWCASQAGVSRNVFPASASCTSHINQFKQQGRFYPSAVRGGSYTPQQGDLLFFYDPKRYPSGNISGHVGLVLYVENGFVYTIEGNTMANRLDCQDTFLIGERDDSKDPLDYVVVNYYPLNNRRILGYASPNYSSRRTLSLSGFVDLGSYSHRASIFEALDTSGIMPATSSHTYSPKHGMTRGDFLTSLMQVYGLSGTGQPVVSYSDVPSSSSYYDTVMAARAAGIIDGAEYFYPDRYISGSEAQTMISRTLQYLGKPNQTFSFSKGDYLDYGDYTIRADLASALYTLSSDAEPDANYTASFQAGEASGTPPSADVSEYNRVTLPSADSLQRLDYIFQGWKSSADQVVYAAGNTVTLQQNTTFTAQWQAAGQNGETAPSNQAILDTSSVRMFQGGKYDFLVKGNNNIASIKAEVADPDIADVILSNAADARGAKYQLTAKKPGSTDVKITSNGQTAIIKVEVETSRASITLDTANYIMAPGDQYTIGVQMTDAAGNPLRSEQIKNMVTQGTLKVRDSRTGSIVNLEQQSNGNFQVTGKNEGTAYIVYEIGNAHASVRIDVKKGVEQHGTAVRNTSYIMY